MPRFLVAPKAGPVVTPKAEPPVVTPKAGPVLGLVGPKEPPSPKVAAASLVAPKFAAPLALVSPSATSAVTSPGYFPAGVATLMTSPPTISGRQPCTGTSPGTRKAPPRTPPSQRSSRSTSAATFSSKWTVNGQVPPFDKKAAMFTMEPERCNLYQMSNFGDDETHQIFHYATGISPESQLLTRNRYDLSWVNCSLRAMALPLSSWAPRGCPAALPRALL